MIEFFKVMVEQAKLMENMIMLYINHVVRKKRLNRLKDESKQNIV